MNGTDKHYDFLDIIRLIASIFVLLIHCPIDGMMGGYITAIGRFAVPFFILVSGFFSDYSDNDTRKAYLCRSSHKTVKLLIKLTVFYAIVNTLCSMIVGVFLLDWLFPFTKKTLIELIVLNRARFICPIIYYLLARIYVNFIDYMAAKNKKFEKVLLLLVIPLLLGNIFLNYFTDLPWYYTGNWLFTFLPLHFIGKSLHKNKMYGCRVSTMLAVIISLAGVILSMFERVFIGDCYFSFGAFILALGMTLLGLNASVGINHSRRYRDLSEVVFCIHYAVMQVIIALTSAVHIYISQNQLVACTIVLSILIAFLSVTGKKYIRQQRR